MTYHLRSILPYSEVKHIFKDLDSSQYLLIIANDNEPFLIITRSMDVLNYIIKRIEIDVLNSDDLPGIEGMRFEGDEGLLKN